MKKVTLIILLLLGVQTQASNGSCRLSEPLKAFKKSIMHALKKDLEGVELKPGSLRIARIADYHNDPKKTSVWGETRLLNFSVTMETVEGYHLSLETWDAFSKKNPRTSGGVTLRPAYYFDQTSELGKPERYCVSRFWGRFVLINRTYNTYVPRSLPNLDDVNSYEPVSSYVNSNDGGDFKQ